MLGIKDVILESALKFWERKRCLGNLGCQIYMTVLLPISKLSPDMKFSQNHFLRRLKKLRLLILKKKIILLSFSSIRSFLYSDLWGFVRLCILYCSLGHWVVVLTTIASIRARNRERNEEKCYFKGKISMDSLAFL